MSLEELYEEKLSEFYINALTKNRASVFDRLCSEPDDTFLRTLNQDKELILAYSAHFPLKGIVLDDSEPLVPAYQFSEHNGAFSSIAIQEMLEEVER